MAWEKRKKRGAYFYTAKAVAGRVVKTYWGSGCVAHQMAAFHWRGCLAREFRNGERAILMLLDREANGLHQRCGTIWRATLLAAGYRQRHGGPWRQRRFSK